MRKFGCEMEEHPELKLRYIGETADLYRVGFLIKKPHKADIIEFIGISTVELNTSRLYKPTHPLKLQRRQKTTNDLQHTLDKTLNKIILIMGCLNAKICQPKREERFIAGYYGYGKHKKRGERQIQYVFEYKLNIMKIYIKKQFIIRKNLC